MPALLHPVLRTMARQTVGPGTAGTFITVPNSTLASGNFTAGRKYLLLVKALVDGPDAGADFEVGTFHGSTQFPDSNWVDEVEFDLEPYQYQFWKVWTAVAGEAISLRIAPRSGTLVYGARHIKIAAIDLTELTEGTDWYSSDVTANTVLGTADSASNNATVGFTPPAGTDWLVLSGSRMLEDSLTIRYRSKLVATGTFASSVPSAEREGEDAVSFGKVLWGMARVYKGLGAVAQTFTEKSLLSGAGAGGETRTHSKVFALNLNRLAKQASAYTEALVDLSATAFATQIQSVTLDTDAADDVLVLSFWTLNNGATGIGGRERLQVGNADITAGETTDSLLQNEAHDPADMFGFFNFDIYATDALAKTYDLDASVETAVAGRGAQYRTLVAFTLSTGGIVGNVVLPPIQASGAGAVRVAGALSKALTLTAVGAGSVSVSGAGIIVLALRTAPATGQVLVKGAGAAVLTLTVAASSSVQAFGTAFVPLVLLASGAGKVAIAGAGNVLLTLSGLFRATLGPLLIPIAPLRQPKRLLRFEVYSQLRRAPGATLLGILRQWYRGVTETDRLNCENTWSLTVPGIPAFVTEDAVLCPVFSDGTYLERRITRITRGKDIYGALTLSVVAEHPLIDFTLRSHLRATDATGRVSHKFTREGITGLEQLQGYIVQEMRDRGFTWWGTGYVEHDMPVRLAFDYHTPKAALDQLRDLLESEMQVRDNGVDTYLVDIVAAAGASQPPIPVRHGANVGSAQVHTALADQADTVYVSGTVSHDQPGTPGGMRWRIRALAHPDVPVYRVYLMDDAERGFGPLRFAGQLVGKRLTWRAPDRTLRQIPITADDPVSQSVELDPVAIAPVWAELVPDKSVGLRGSAGEELTYVQKPGARPLAMRVERNDISGANNLIPGPVFRHWVTDGAGVPIRPVHWNPTSLDGVTISRNLFPTYWETGGASVLLQTLRPDEGLVSDIFPLDEGTIAVPANTVDIRAWIDAGQMYLMLELFTDTSDAPVLTIGRDPDEPEAVVNEAVTKEWWTDLSMHANVATVVARWNQQHPEAPVVNDFTRARVSVRQRGAVRVRAYVDRLQLTETEDTEPFAEGSGAAQLWHIGNLTLEKYAGPADTLAMNYRDLAPLGGRELPFDMVTAGRVLAARIDPLNITRNTRVTSVTKNWDSQQNTDVQTDGQPWELTRHLAAAV